MTGERGIIAVTANNMEPIENREQVGFMDELEEEIEEDIDNLRDR